jgi:dTDP-4-dehydrorhamnose 3,5-epimerase-like enzyme
MVELEQVQPIPIGAYTDDRGVLYKALRRTDPHVPETFGELYVLITKKGKVRGNHYHRQTTEWFIVVRGTMRCRLADVKTGERSEHILDAHRPSVLRAPPGIAHSLTGLSEAPALLLAYADREYDEEAPDQVPFDFSGAAGGAS